MANARVASPRHRERLEQQAALARDLGAAEAVQEEVRAKLRALTVDEATKREQAQLAFDDALKQFDDALKQFEALKHSFSALKQLGAEKEQLYYEKEQLYEQLLRANASARSGMAAELVRRNGDVRANAEAWQRHLDALTANRAETQAQAVEMRAAADEAIRKAEEAHDENVLPLMQQLLVSIEAAAGRHRARLAAAAADDAPQGCAAQAKASFPT